MKAQNVKERNKENITVTDIVSDVKEQYGIKTSETEVKKILIAIAIEDKEVISKAIDYLKQSAYEEELKVLKEKYDISISEEKDETDTESTPKTRGRKKKVIIEESEDDETSSYF